MFYCTFASQNDYFIVSLPCTGAVLHYDSMEIAVIMCCKCLAEVSHRINTLLITCKKFNRHAAYHWLFEFISYVSFKGFAFFIAGWRASLNWFWCGLFVAREPNWHQGLIENCNPFRSRASELKAKYNNACSRGQKVYNFRLQGGCVQLVESFQQCPSCLESRQLATPHG